MDLLLRYDMTWEMQLRTPSSTDVSFRVVRGLIISSDSNIGIVNSGKVPCVQELEMATRKLGRNRVLLDVYLVVTPDNHHET